MSFIKAADLGKKVLDDYNAAMEEQDRMKQPNTLIDVVAKHEKEIQELQELQRLVTPMMEFNQQMPTKIVGPNLVGVLNAAGFYKKEAWVGLTDEDIKDIVGRNDPGGIGRYTRDLFKKIEDKLKEKNGG